MTKTIYPEEKRLSLERTEKKNSDRLEVNIKQKRTVIRGKVLCPKALRILNLVFPTDGHRKLKA